MKKLGNIVKQRLKGKENKVQPIWILTLLMAFWVNSSAVAQSDDKSASPQYSNAIGIRFGGQTSGFTATHYITPSSAIEGILSAGYRNLVLTGLYERHFKIKSEPGLGWYFGGGGHAGLFWNRGRYFYYHKGSEIIYVERDEPARAVLGADMIIGLEYTFQNIPLNLGVDLKPFIDFFEGPYGYMDGALSVRYVF